jgi:hypothetical protein
MLFSEIFSPSGGVEPTFLDALFRGNAPRETFSAMENRHRDSSRESEPAEQARDCHRLPSTLLAMSRCQRDEP